MPETSLLPKHWSLAGRTFVAVAAFVLVLQCISMVRWAGRGASDIGVFLRSIHLLDEGAGAEFYTKRDALSGWYRTIPPPGLCLFQPAAHLNAITAGSLWAILNLGFLTAAILALAACIHRIEDGREHYARAFPWIVGVLVILASSSIQVGQFSVLFAACWIASLAALLHGRPFWAGTSLALPSVIKLYPVLMLAYPMVGRARRQVPVLAGFLFGAVLLGAVAPLMAFGPRAISLTESFIQNAILGNDGRVAGYSLLDAGYASSEGLDTVMTRYLTDSPDFHSRYPWIPHLSMDRRVASLSAHLVRLAILLVTVIAMLKLRKCTGRRPSDVLLQSAALWSAALYAVMPETKARYAVQTILAFMPLFLLASRAQAERDRAAFLGSSAAIVFCLAMLIQVHPMSVRAFGVGYVGQLLLWAINVRLSMAPWPRAVSGPRPANNTRADTVAT